MKRILLICFMLLSALVTESWAQDRSVSGKVTDEDGEAIPGVNIILKGTTTGATSDIDGNWKLSIPSEGGTLVFQFVGMATQEIKTGSRSVIDVVMVGDAKQLAEVVVTAVGIERQAKALGYAVENVDGDAVQQISEPDAIRGLQGKIAGVNIIGSSGAPGSATRITIRGNSSLLNDNQPLFVVDGVPYNNDAISSDGVNSNIGGLSDGGAFGSMISTLDPNTIESITVLKGGSAAALYGSRAANGVVVITTKGGSVGASKKGLEVALSLSTGWEQIANLPNYQNTYGVGTNFSYAQANGSWGHPFPGTRPYASLDEIPHWFSGRPGMEAYNGQTVPYRAYPNNVKDFFQTGRINDMSVTVSGGNEKSVISATASMLNQSGFVPKTEYNRYAFSVGGKTFLDNGLSVGTNVSYTRSTQNGAISGVGALGSNNPSAFARTLYLGRNWDLQGQEFQNPVDNGSEFFVGRGQANNPYWAVENTGIKNRTDRYVVSMDLNYEILDWLSATARLGLNGYSTKLDEWQRPNGTGNSLGEYGEFNVNFLEVNTDFILSANKQLNQDISLSANVGYNINQRTNEAQRTFGQQYVIFDIDDIDNMVSVTPDGGTYQRRRLLGVYGEATLDYKSQIFLNFTGRNDQSSTLPAGNNSYFYPAVSTSFILSDLLDFTSSTVNMVKVRAGWSQVGNDTDPYQIQNVYLVNDAIDTNPKPTAEKPFNGSPGITYNNIAKNPNLKPENTTEIEVGAEIRALDNKVTLDVALYKKNTTDQIIQAPLAEETGFTFGTVNAGEVENKGIEVALDWTVVDMPNGLQWDLRGSFTHNKNTVISTGDLDEIQFGSAFANNIIATHRPGYEYGLLLGTVDYRDDEGNLLIDPANGQLIQNTARAIVGNPNPDFILGVVSNLAWKGISLRAVFDWKQGGDIYSNTVLSMLGRGILAHQGDREMNWIIPGVYGDPNTGEAIRDESGNKIPNATMIETNSLYFGQSFAINGSNEWNVYDGTVYRLREVALGYSLPKSVMDKTPFGSANISLTGRNLWYLAPNFPKDTNYDPETNQFGNRNNQGIELSTTPSARRYSVNLKFTF